MGVQPSGGGGGGEGCRWRPVGPVSKQNSGAIRFLRLCCPELGACGHDRFWEGHRPHWDREEDCVQKKPFILKIAQLVP